MMLKQRGQSARRAIALIGTASLALAALIASGGAAQAAEDDPPPVVVANITGTEGTLYIHKHAGEPIGEGNGQETVSYTHLDVYKRQLQDRRQRYRI